MSNPSPSHFQTIVIGVGSMGSAACYYLAKRGQSVLGLEQFDTPHEKGSHAGQSRIIRKAYFEHPDYVPLLERSYENWKKFELETGSQFYHRTGVVYFGKPENENIEGIRRAAVLHNIRIENLHRADAQKKFPLFQVPDDFDTIFEPDAGFVTPERAIEAYVRQAENLGAVVVRNSPVTMWKLEGNKIRVSAAAGEYTADKLVITAGAWAARVAPQLTGVSSSDSSTARVGCSAGSGFIFIRKLSLLVCRRSCTGYFLWIPCFIRKWRTSRA